MDEHNSRFRERRSTPSPLHHSEGRVHYLLEAEEQILRLIGARAPLPQILNEICTALDCQIGNMVSLFSLAGEDVANIPEIARNAALFGLHIFFSGVLFGEGNEEIGSLEMYCCATREPFFHELRWIERAACLAAIAIECDFKSRQPADRHLSDSVSVRGNAPGWPISLN